MGFFFFFSRGDLLINGEKQSIEYLKPVIGFVPQDRHVAARAPEAGPAEIGGGATPGEKVALAQRLHMQLSPVVWGSVVFGVVVWGAVVWG